MAHNRAERIGTIFSRMTSLVQGGAVAKENIPLWYEIYKAFPPMYEPTYNRPASTKPIRNIFYKEDIARAKFHKQMTRLQSVDLKLKEHSETQKFLIKYSEYLQEGFSETEAYEKVMTTYDLHPGSIISRSKSRVENFHNSKVETET